VAILNVLLFTTIAWWVLVWEMAKSVRRESDAGGLRGSKEGVSYYYVAIRSKKTQLLIMSIRLVGHSA
jgi:hypothetical protein